MMTATANLFLGSLRVSNFSFANGASFSNSYYNIISLSRNEQVCLKILVHDVIHLIYHEHETDKRKYLDVKHSYTCGSP